MFKLLKRGRCFTPKDIGQKDILVVFDKICRIEDQIKPENFPDVEVIDCQGCLVCPGFIDQHVHIIGGGGEQGPLSRTPEIMLSNIIKAGVTSLVGVLGFDSVTRSISGLLAKARALEKEGITTYLYSGSYGIPTATLTGRVLTDIALIDKVVGVGEIAISDQRSSHPSLESLREIASEARTGGMLGGKAGVVHIHIGDGKEGLSPLLQLLNESDFPIEMFVPTHMNRSQKLFEQGIKLLKSGGNIDLTAGEAQGLRVPDAMERLVHENMTTMDHVTLTSDGNGSIPQENSQFSMGKVTALLDDFRACILEKGLNIETVLRTVTLNPAMTLKLFPRKGSLQPGSDADILVFKEKNLEVYKLLAKGNILIHDEKTVKKGTYES